MCEFSILIYVFVRRRLTLEAKSPHRQRVSLARHMGVRRRLTLEAKSPHRHHVSLGGHMGVNHIKWDPNNESIHSRASITNQFGSRSPVMTQGDRDFEHPQYWEEPRQ